MLYSVSGVFDALPPGPCLLPVNHADSIDLLYRPARIRKRNASWLLAYFLKPLTAAGLALLIFYLSLLATSTPLRPSEAEQVRQAIAVLENKGYKREVFMLRNLASFRNFDNWLNQSVDNETAYAATNFPFEIVTIYPDFYAKAADDTERAMILLHEAQHLAGADEAQAYERVWRSRGQLGWTMLSHGTTPVFVTVEEQTRENAPHLFTCEEKLWKDCTETHIASR
jgi:hypothetical protein